MQSTYAERHKHHEEFFTVWKPGLLESVPNADFLSFVEAGDYPGSYGFYERRPHITPRGIEKEYAAVIIEMTGRIRRENFYFTTDGAGSDPILDESDCPSRFASCWLDPPSADNSLERAVWRRGLRRLKALGTEHGYQTSELVQPDPAPGNIPSPLLLQVQWSPPTNGADAAPARDSMSLMPVFTSENEHVPFDSLESVPFGRRVRVRVTLRATGNILGARLLSMHLL